jgi:hypothetical protein
MIARMIIGGFVVGPAFYARPALSFAETAWCTLFALAVALCIPDSWHE